MTTTTTTTAPVYRLRSTTRTIHIDGFGEGTAPCGAMTRARYLERGNTSEDLGALVGEARALADAYGRSLCKGCARTARYEMDRLAVQAIADEVADARRATQDTANLAAVAAYRTARDTALGAGASAAAAGHTAAYSAAKAALTAAGVNAWRADEMAQKAQGIAYVNA